MRSFSRRFTCPLLVAACALALVACTSTTTFEPDSDTAHIPALQLKVTKPPTWKFLSRREAREIEKSLNSTNKALNYVYYQDAWVPFLSIERNRRSDSQFQVILSVDRRALEELRLTSSEKAAAILIWDYLNLVEGAKIAGSTTTVTIAGQPFAHGCVKYPLAFKDGRSFEIERHFWVKTSAISCTMITVAFDVKEIREIWPEVQETLTSMVPETKK